MFGMLHLGPGGEFVFEDADDRPAQVFHGVGIGVEPGEQRGCERVPESNGVKTCNSCSSLLVWQFCAMIHDFHITEVAE